MKTQRKKGFTVVELVIVIAVIAILAAVLIPTFVNLTKKANEAAALADARNAANQLLANLLARGDDAKDLVIFNQKGDDIYVYGYSAEAGRVLAYHGSPIDANSIAVTEGATGKDAFQKRVTSLLTQMVTSAELQPIPADTKGDWWKPENMEKTVSDLNFKPEEMILRADYKIILPRFEKGVISDGEHSCQDHLKLIERREATCGTEGWEAYWMCTVCGKIFSDERAENEITGIRKIPTTGTHDYTYVSNGESGHTGTCKNCGATVTETHTLGSDGKCTKCGFQSNPCAEGHLLSTDESDCRIVRDSTCTQTGVKVVRCTRCGSWIEQEIPMHHYVYVRTGNPYKVAHSAKCTGCSSYKENEACNTDDDGECSCCHGEKGTCSAADTQLDKHFFLVYVKDIIKEQPEFHSVKCLACGAYPLNEPHDTLGEGGACSVCQYKEHEHVVAAWTTTREATCTKDGEKKGNCTYELEAGGLCDKTIKQVIPALGHSITSAYTDVNAFNHGGECERCKQSVVLAHSFSKQETINGKDRYACDCGVLLDIPTGTVLTDITGHGCNIYASDWGQNTATIDGKEYLIFKGTCNSGTANGKDFVYYVPKK